MQEEKNAVLHIGKELLSISLMTLAAIGGATGNAWLAGGATAIPSAFLLADVFKQLRIKPSEVELMLPVPPWWSADMASWQTLCSAVEQKLPTIVQDVSHHIQQTQQVPTSALVQHYFMEALARHLPGWDVQPQDRNMIVGYFTSPLLEKSAEVLKPAIDAARDDVLNQQLTKIVDIFAGAGTCSQSLQAASISSAAIQQPVSSSARQTNLSAVATILEQKRQQNTYDVYICYMPQDEIEVLNIGQQLKQNGILPWFDNIEVRPGTLSGAEQDRQIQNIPVAAICIGQYAIAGKLERQMYAFLSQYDQRGCVVIPVILPATPSQAELRPYIGEFSSVDFRDIDSKPLYRLIWGITGTKPEELNN